MICLGLKLGSFLPKKYHLLIGVGTFVFSLNESLWFT